jgi:hypothetical protein
LANGLAGADTGLFAEGSAEFAEALTQLGFGFGDGIGHDLTRLTIHKILFTIVSVYVDNIVNNKRKNNENKKNGSHS